MDGSPVRLARPHRRRRARRVPAAQGGILTTDVALLGDFVVSARGCHHRGGLLDQRGSCELRRYLPNGTLDAAFGAGGRIALQMREHSVQVWAVDFAPAGGLVIAGGGFVVTGGGGAPIVFTRHAIDRQADGVGEPGYHVLRGPKASAFHGRSRRSDRVLLRRRRRIRRSRRRRRRVTRRACGRQDDRVAHARREAERGLRGRRCAACTPEAHRSSTAPRRLGATRRRRCPTTRGGFVARYLLPGGRYDPAGDSASPTSTADATRARWCIDSVRCHGNRRRCASSRCSATRPAPGSLCSRSATRW